MRLQGAPCAPAGSAHSPLQGLGVEAAGCVPPLLQSPLPGRQEGNLCPSVPPSPQNLNIQVEDIRIRAILAAYRKRTPVTEGYVEVKDGRAWKQICDKHWTAKNSRVVCGMFGFPGVKTYNAKVYK